MTTIICFSLFEREKLITPSPLLLIRIGDFLFIVEEEEESLMGVFCVIG
jgi:hypothetical protein